MYRCIKMKHYLIIMKGNIMKFKGFTLAEVLITLAIIGVVAALTIPSVISNYQQQEFKTGLKKAVSVLNEAIQTNIAQDGITPYDRPRTNGSIEFLDEYLKKHMSVIKDVVGSGVGSRYLSDETTWQGVSQNNAFYTTDGMRFETYMHNGGLGCANCKLHESGTMLWHATYNQCGSYGLTNNPNNTKNTPCLILVDVNGDKKPTVYSSNVTIADDGGSVKKNYQYPNINDKKLTDIFLIMITEDRAIPFGVVAQRAMYSK